MDKTKEVTRAVSILSEINEAYLEIPFGNTQFQNEMFVISHNITPARMYRSIGLEIQVRIDSLRRAQTDERKRLIEIEKLKRKINAPETDEFDKQLYEIDLEIALDPHAINSAAKRFNDALEELNYFYSVFKKFPKYTREQFEAEERLHFEQRLQRQALGLSGAQESLLNMMDDKGTLKTFCDRVKELPDNSTPEQMQQLAFECLQGYISLQQQKAVE
jgi:hypothetical protein